MAKNPPSKAGPPQVSDLRHHFEHLHEHANESLSGTFKGKLEQKTIKISSAEIPITVYTPADVNKDKLGVFFHGGGWVAGSTKTHQTIVNSMADISKTTWINVEYRLGPENKFPGWLDDATEVIQYVLQNKTSFGVDQNAKVGVAGDSAGGMISASLSRTVKGIAFQILVYPVLDVTPQTASYQEFTQPMYFLTPDILKWFAGNGYSSPEQYKDPRVAILSHQSYENLPPCLFIVTELDILRDDSIEYQKLLEKAGVPAKVALMKGTIHGFFSLPGIYPEQCAEALNAIRDFLASLN